MILNLGIGLNTPPLGPVQFVAAAVGKITIWDAMRSIWPFYGAGLVVLLHRDLHPGRLALAAVALPLKGRAHAPPVREYPAVDAGNNVMRRVLAENDAADDSSSSPSPPTASARRTATRTSSRPT